MKKIRQKYPLIFWLGKYEAWYSKLNGKRSLKDLDRKLRSFFDAYPNKQWLTEFTETDIHDWAIVLKQKGLSDMSVAFSISRIRTFWRWCKRDRRLHLLDIGDRVSRKVLARISNLKRGKNTKALNSFEELRAIYAQIKYSDLRKYIAAAVEGSIVPTGKHPDWFGREFAAASIRAGFEYSIRDFLYSINKLRCWVLQDLHEQFCNSLALEAERIRTPFTYIQATPFHERPPVIHAAQYHPPINGIREFKKRIKRERLMRARQKAGIEILPTGG